MGDRHEPPIRIEPLMDELRARVRVELRARLLERGGSSEFSDRQLFEAVAHLFEQGLELRDRDALLLPELLRDEAEWHLDTPLRLSSHRRMLGRAIIFAKRRLVLPLTRWLYEYTHVRFRRQHQLNRTFFALLEALAVENARLRRDLEALQQAEPGSAPRTR